MSNSFWPHGLQHARLPCSSATPGVYSTSCPLTQWSHPTISFSVVPFSSCLQSLPASGSFPMSQFFLWKFFSGGQRIGASALATVLPMNIRGWFPFGMDWLDLLAVQGILKNLLQHHSSKASILWHSYYHYIKNLTILFFFWPCCTTCGISVPWPGFEPRLQQLRH